MGLLDELDKYRSISELIKTDENYDKKRNILTGEEVYKLCQDRYELLQEVLHPLKKKLGENIEIIDIGFVRGMQDDTHIGVRYNKNDKQNIFSISKSDFNDIEIKCSDELLEKLGFVRVNKKLILDTFKRIGEENLDEEVSINSTSKKFVINDTITKFVIRDAASKIFSIEGSHASFAKDGLMYNKEKINIGNPKIKESLENDENVMNVYRHLRVYEEDIPKVLIKKTNQ